MRKKLAQFFLIHPKSYHWSFEDPPHAMQEGESEIDAFRRIRDQIKLVFEAYVSGYRDAQ